MTYLGYEFAGEGSGSLGHLEVGDDLVESLVERERSVRCPGPGIGSAENR
jgi:hypothetical protein